MSYASDKLYNGYLRRNMPTIVSKVKVREIIVHLPCLTAHDRVSFTKTDDCLRLSKDNEVKIPNILLSFLLFLK